MKKIVLLLILTSSCANFTPSKKVDEDNLVTITTALEQAQMSYLRGCVEANKEILGNGNFPKCKDKAKNHRDEIQSILDSKIIRGEI